MDMPIRRTKTTVEHVITVGEGMDAKEYDFQRTQIMEAMRSEGVDFTYDDCFHVRVADGEIVFYYPEKS